MDRGLAEYERLFRRAGLPLFIEGYKATEDVFTRAVPLLTLVFLLEVLGAVNLRWGATANAGAFLGGVAIMLGTLGILNVARDRPFLSRPRKIGVPELTVFVVLPALLPLVFGGQVVSAGVTVLGNLVLLGLVNLVVGYGVLSIVRWAGERFVRQLAASLGLIARTVPLLLIFSLLLFLTQEMWQMYSTAPTPFVVASGVLFLLLGTLFLAGRLPGEVRELEREASPSGAPLTRRQRANVGLVLFISQALQVLLVSVVVGLFFVTFGALLVGPAVREQWMGTQGHVIRTMHLLGHPIQITRELLVVSSALAAFSGLYYAIAILVDSSYRDRFLDEITEQMKETFARRAEYLELLEAAASAAPPGDEP